MRIVISEYPKSGGTWIVSLIGDALGLPKRDIYIGEGYNAFNVHKHPWYTDAPDLNLTDSCVIKSHELPNSALVQFPMRPVHLVRDGRDVIVSKFFYERDFCVPNGIYSKFDDLFDDYVPRVAAEWNDYVLAWLNTGVPVIHYEDFLAAPMTAAQRLLADISLEVSIPAIQGALEKNTKEKLHAALDIAFEHNTFIRSGTSGDWRNHFQERHIYAFRRIADVAMQRLGYW